MKKILLLVVVFASGFLTHAFFFPDVLSNGLMDAKNIIIPNPTPANGVNQDDQLITKIKYDGERFERHNISIRKANYLHITNTHETKRMELIGTINELSTPE